MLKDRISAAEKQMKARLAETRASFKHKGIKGDHAEEGLREFLRQYLPRRYSVGHGEVVDLDSNRSSQTDVVVANDEHPFMYPDDIQGLFFVEGVCAGGEVKSILTKAELDKTLENSRTWKKLKARPGKGTLINTNPEDRDRFYANPPYFLFAYESQLSMEAVEAQLKASGSYIEQPERRQLDAVFVLDKGVVIDMGGGKGSLQFRVNGEAQPGWQRSDTENVLFEVVRWLTIVMPRMVRFEPVLASYFFGLDERDTK